KLHLSASDDNELAHLLADRAKNPDGGFLWHLYNQFHITQLGNRNGKGMFDQLQEMVNQYNESNNGKAILQIYNSTTSTPFILCIVTSLIARVHEKIRQAGELCYLDASAAFDPLNTSISLLYTSCMVGALPLGIFLTSDEAEVTIENAINLLKTILPANAFYGRGPEIGPKVIITDYSNAERNALQICWPTYDRIPIMNSLKTVLYAPTIPKMDEEFTKFKELYFTKYRQLESH
ncbi:3558_t:CDS:2, partial [Scutellospora calospora]